MSIIAQDVPLVAAAYMRVLRHSREDVQMQLLKAQRRVADIPFLKRIVAELDALIVEWEEEGETLERRERFESLCRKAAAAGYPLRAEGALNEPQPPPLPPQDTERSR